MTGTVQRSFFFLLTALAAITLPLGSSHGGSTGQVDPAKPYGKICFSVVTHGKEGRKEDAFGPESGPGPDEWVMAHAIASDPCVLLIAAFDRDSEGPANGWRPQIAELETSWEEIAFPKAAAWSWQAGSAQVDLYAVLIHPDSRDVDGLKRLVGAMQRPDADPDLLRSQAEKLRELITGLCGDADPQRHRAAVAPVQVGGVLRGGEEIVWRQFAAKVNFAEGHPGLLIFSNRPAANPVSLQRKMKLEQFDRFH